MSQRDAIIYHVVEMLRESPMNFGSDACVLLVIKGARKWEVFLFFLLLLNPTRGFLRINPERKKSCTLTAGEGVHCGLAESLIIGNGEVFKGTYFAYLAISM